jgi:hypothetical protein
MKKLKVLPSMQCDTGCGECCGIVPVTVTEFATIESKKALTADRVVCSDRAR